MTNKKKKKTPYSCSYSAKLTATVNLRAFNIQRYTYKPFDSNFKPIPTHLSLSHKASCTFSLSKPTMMSHSLSLSEPTVSHSLPTDVIFDILSRLLVKFVTWFKCVSKAWFTHLGNGIHKMPPEVRWSQEEYLCLRF